MKLQTFVELPSHIPFLSHEQKIMLIGSCFTEHLGRKLQEAKFQIDINPFGIQYNPLSISTALLEITEGKVYKDSDLFFYQGLWHSFMHHGDFSAATCDEVLSHINTSLQQAHDVFPELDWLLLTLGTARVYTHQATNHIVSNCHKLPEKTFTRHLLTPEEIVNVYYPLLTDYFASFPRLKVMFTVSPVRHIRDGMHGNQLSKATLLLAIDRLVQLFPNRVFYFPSYEIVLDELRDYRFYADDLLHPSSFAVEYIWERFASVCFSEETKQVILAVENIRKALAHRPFQPHSEAYQRFLEQIVLKIEQLKGKYPYLDFQKEIELCHTQLKL